MIAQPTVYVALAWADETYTDLAQVNVFHTRAEADAWAGDWMEYIGRCIVMERRVLDSALDEENHMTYCAWCEAPITDNNWLRSDGSPDGLESGDPVHLECWVTAIDSHHANNSTLHVPLPKGTRS